MYVGGACHCTSPLLTPDAIPQKEQNSLGTISLIQPGG